MVTRNAELAEKIRTLRDHGQSKKNVHTAIGENANMDGFQVLAEIKRSHPSVPVIILTGHGTVESAIKGMKLGVFSYLTKPCDLETLAKRIREAALQRRSSS